MKNNSIFALILRCLYIIMYILLVQLSVPVHHEQLLPFAVVTVHRAAIKCMYTRCMHTYWLNIIKTIIRRQNWKIDHHHYSFTTFWKRGILMSRRFPGGQRDKDTKNTVRADGLTYTCRATVHRIVSYYFASRWLYNAARLYCKSEDDRDNNCVAGTWCRRSVRHAVMERRVVDTAFLSPDLQTKCYGKQNSKSKKSKTNLRIYEFTKTMAVD